MPSLMEKKARQLVLDVDQLGELTRGAVYDLKMAYLVDPESEYQSTRVKEL